MREHFYGPNTGEKRNLREEWVLLFLHSQFHSTHNTNYVLRYFKYSLSEGETNIVETNNYKTNQYSVKGTC